MEKVIYDISAKVTDFFWDDALLLRGQFANCPLFQFATIFLKVWHSAEKFV